MRRLVLGAAGVAGVLLLTGCAHTTSQSFGPASDSDPSFAALQWRLFFAPLLLIAYAVVTGVFSLVAAIVTLRSVARAAPVRRWPLITAALLLAVLSLGGIVLLVLRLVSDETLTVVVTSISG